VEGKDMKKAFITLLSLLFLSMPAYAWEMYVSNEGTNSITVYNQAGQLIDTIPLDARPNQLFFRTNGNLYVACSVNSPKIVIIQGHNIIGSISPPGGVGGMALGKNNHIYVGGYAGGHLINEYDENDILVKSFPIPVATTAITVGPNGNLFIVDNGGSVSEVDLNGNIVHQFSTGQGSYPRGIAFGPDGFICVAGDGMNNVSVFDPNTFARTRTITGVTAPYGIAFDPENHHLLIANFGANNILEYLYTGEFQRVFVSSSISRPNFIAFKSSGTSTTTSAVTTTTTIAPTSESFEVTFNWTDSFQIYGWEPVPQINGFDYYFSTEKINNSFAGHRIKINSIEVSAPGTSLGNVINFGIEVHLNGSDITLPEGQFIQTHIDPLTAYTRNAETQCQFGIGGPDGSNSYIFSAAYDYTLGSGSAYPTLNGFGTLSNPEMVIGDGLHAQVYSWTGDNRNCKIVFSGATLKVKGVILDGTTTTTIPINSDLIAYYPFNGNANDESGNGRNATVYGVTLTTDRFGNPNGAYSFDGVDNYIETSNNLNNYQTVSVSFWLYMRTYPEGDRYQLVSNDAGSWGRVININNNKVIALFNSSTAYDSTIVLPLNQWHLLTAIWTKDYSRLYVDQELKIDFAGSIDSLNDLSSYYIGRDTWSGTSIRDYFDGIIDELRIYNRALSEAEIQELYNVTPTLINLSSFYASSKANKVILEWSTESEIDNAGFNLYRSESENGEYSKINTSLIPAQGSSTRGSSYEFIDNAVQNRKTYYYKLEDIDLNGTSTVHGPVSAMPRWIYGMINK
jgi:hypothetical protein